MKQDQHHDQAAQAVADARRELLAIQQQLETLRQHVGRQLDVERLAGEQSFVLCRVGDHHYGLPLDAVEEARQFCRLEPIPQSQPWMLGLMQLRNILVPVVDVHARLGFSSEKPGLNDFIIVCQAQKHKVGLLVQDIGAIQHTHADTIRPIDDDVADTTCVLGLAQVDGKPTFVLSISGMCSTLGSIEIIE